MVEPAHTRDVRREHAWLCLVVILLLATGLRFVGLERVPPGFAPDEASNGYDAYSLLLTGRDQHGALLPLVLRGFNDYRMPLFTYSVIPFIGLFGLTPASVRLTAAFWGLVTVPLAYWLGARMVNRRTGVVTALLCALSPWHIAFSRLGLEGTLVAFSVALAMAFLWQWQTDHRSCWLIGAGVALGLSVYTYSIAKFFAPAVLALAALFWKDDVKRHFKAALVALALAACLALPMAYLTLRYPDQMQARYNQIAIFRPDRPLPEALREFIGLAAIHFSPDYLFIKGDTDILQHPPFGGQLYWVQAPLLIISLLMISQTRYRRAVGFNIAWLLMAAIPAALTEPNNPGSGHSLRNILALVPFQTLSAIGLNWIWETHQLRPWSRAIAIGLVALALSLNAGWFLRQYVQVYPPQVASRFEDGLQQLVETMYVVEKNYPVVVVSDKINSPYIYILFFTRYDPVRLHADPPVRGQELFAPVTRVGHYIFGDVEQEYAEREHGLFLCRAWVLYDVPELAVIRRPSDRKPMFRLAIK